MEDGLLNTPADKEMIADSGQGYPFMERRQSGGMRKGLGVPVPVLEILENGMQGECSQAVDLECSCRPDEEKRGRQGWRGGRAVKRVGFSS